MSNLPYKNPISPLQSLGTQSVGRTDTFGTNFSVLGTGGFMEVYNLSDLEYTIPIGQTGTIEFSGNTIPIQFKKGSGSVFSPDVLTLNSDNISSGRRRIGMLVYVYETDKIYQFTIRNYDSLWSGATGATGPGGQTVVVSDFGTTIKNNSVAGQNFINAWTGSTIDGVNGFTSANASWRILQTGGGSGSTVSGDYLPLSGGTVSGNTIFLSGLSATAISATTYQNYPGASASNCVTTFFVSNISGCSPVTILTPLYVTEGAEVSGTTRFHNDVNFSSGFSINSPSDVSILTLSGDNIGIGTTNPKTLLQVGDGGGDMLYPYEQLVVEKNGDTKLSIYTSSISPVGVGASLSLGYSKFLTNSGYFPGFEFQHMGNSVDGENYIRYNYILRANPSGLVSGATIDLFNIYADGSVIFNSPNSNSRLGVGVNKSAVTNTLHISATTNPVRFQGLSSSTSDTNVITVDNTGVLHTYPLSGLTGGTSIVSGNYLPLSGGTVTGNTIFNSGLTATTISATTYFNLPVTADTFVTGFTFNTSTYDLTIKQNNGESDLTQSLSILASDLTVTGGTYDSNTGVATFTNNTGGTFQVSGFLTGFTDTLVTAFTYNNNTFTITDSRGSAFTASINTMTGLTATTISATTYQNLPSQSGTGISAFSYSPTTGVLTITKNDTNTLTAGTFSYVSATTLSSSNVLSVSSNGGTPTTTTINAVTGGSYSNGTITLSGTGTIQSAITGFTKYFTTGSTPTGVVINSGDRWYNTNNGIELVYIDDGNSSQWVQPANTPGPPGYSNLMITSGITTSAVTLSINTNYYGVNYNGNVNLTLPNPSGYDGYNMTIKDEGGYSSTYIIRLTPLSGLIDGNAYVDMNLNYIALHLVARNNNWWLI